MAYELLLHVSHKRGPVLESFSRFGTNVLALPIFNNWIYTFEAVGKDQIPIVVQKIRTMECDADSRLPPRENGLNGLGKPVNDNRVIPGRERLRIKHYDELPQLFSLGSGDLDLVGPRAKSLSYWLKYHSEEQMVDCTRVRPGLFPVVYACGDYVEEISKGNNTLAREIAEDYEKNYSMEKSKYPDYGFEEQDKRLFRIAVRNLRSGKLKSC